MQVRQQHSSGAEHGSNCQISKSGGKQSAITHMCLSSHQYNSLSHVQRASEASSLRPRTELEYASLPSQKGSLGAQPERRGARRRLVALGVAGGKHNSIQPLGTHTGGKFESTQAIRGGRRRPEVEGCSQLELKHINQPSFIDDPRAKELEGLVPMPVNNFNILDDFGGNPAQEEKLGRPASVMAKGMNNTQQCNTGRGGAACLEQGRTDASEYALLREHNSNEALVGKEIVITVEEEAQEGMYQLAGMASQYSQHGSKQSMILEPMNGLGGDREHSNSKRHVAPGQQLKDLRFTAGQESMRSVTAQSHLPEFRAASNLLVSSKVQAARAVISRASDPKLSAFEKKMWRKSPTMMVKNMISNLNKTRAENIYIAEQKFKCHQEQDMSYEDIRQSLNKTYGGFNEEGRYFHKESIFELNSSTEETRAIIAAQTAAAHTQGRGASSLHFFQRRNSQNAARARRKSQHDKRVTSIMHATHAAYAVNEYQHQQLHQSGMEAKNMRALKSLYYTKQQYKSRGGQQAAPNEKTKQQQAYQHAHSRSDYTSSSQKNQHIVKNMNISDLVSKFKQFKEEQIQQQLSQSQQEKGEEVPAPSHGERPISNPKSASNKKSNADSRSMLNSTLDYISDQIRHSRMKQAYQNYSDDLMREQSNPSSVTRGASPALLPGRRNNLKSKNQIERNLTQTRKVFEVRCYTKTNQTPDHQLQYPPCNYSNYSFGQSRVELEPRDLAILESQNHRISADVGSSSSKLHHSALEAMIPTAKGRNTEGTYLIGTKEHTNLGHTSSANTMTEHPSELQLAQSRELEKNPGSLMPISSDNRHHSNVQRPEQSGIEAIEMGLEVSSRQIRAASISFDNEEAKVVDSREPKGILIHPLANHRHQQNMKEVQLAGESQPIPKLMPHTYAPHLQKALQQLLNSKAQLRCGLSRPLQTNGMYSFSQGRGFSQTADAAQSNIIDLNSHFNESLNNAQLQNFARFDQHISKRMRDSSLHSPPPASMRSQGSSPPPQPPQDNELDPTAAPGSLAARPRLQAPFSDIRIPNKFIHLAEVGIGMSSQHSSVPSYHELVDIDQAASGLQVSQGTQHRISKNTHISEETRERTSNQSSCYCIVTNPNVQTQLQESPQNGSTQETPHLNHRVEKQEILLQLPSSGTQLKFSESMEGRTRNDGPDGIGKHRKSQADVIAEHDLLASFGEKKSKEFALAVEELGTRQSKAQVRSSAKNSEQSTNRKILLPTSTMAAKDSKLVEAAEDAAGKESPSFQHWEQKQIRNIEPVVPEQAKNLQEFHDGSSDANQQSPGRHHIHFGLQGQQQSSRESMTKENQTTNSARKPSRLPSERRVDCKTYKGIVKEVLKKSEQKRSDSRAGSQQQKLDQMSEVQGCVEIDVGGWQTLSHNKQVQHKTVKKSKMASSEPPEARKMQDYSKKMSRSPRCQSQPEAADVAHVNEQNAISQREKEQARSSDWEMAPLGDHPANGLHQDNKEVDSLPRPGRPILAGGAASQTCPEGGAPGSHDLAGDHQGQTAPSATRKVTKIHIQENLGGAEDDLQIYEQVTDQTLFKGTSPPVGHTPPIKSPIRLSSHQMPDANGREGPASSLGRRHQQAFDPVQDACAQGHPHPYSNLHPSSHQVADAGRYPAGLDTPDVVTSEPLVAWSWNQALDRQESHGWQPRAGIQDQPTSFAETGAARAADWPPNVPVSHSEAFVRLSGNQQEPMQSPKFSNYNRINFDKIRDIESLEEIREMRREIQTIQESMIKISNINQSGDAGPTNKSRLKSNPDMNTLSRAIEQEERASRSKLVEAFQINQSVKDELIRASNSVSASKPVRGSKATHVVSISSHAKNSHRNNQKDLTSRLSLKMKEEAAQVSNSGNAGIASGRARQTDSSRTNRVVLSVKEERLSARAPEVVERASETLPLTPTAEKPDALRSGLEQPNDEVTTRNQDAQMPEGFLVASGPSAASDRSLFIDLDYMMYLSQNLELLHIKELKLKAQSKKEKQDREQEYVNRNIEQHANELANMHKSELKPREYKFQDPPEPPVQSGFVSISSINAGGSDQRQHPPLETSKLKARMSKHVALPARSPMPIKARTATRDQIEVSGYNVAGTNMESK